MNRKGKSPSMKVNRIYSHHYFSLAVSLLVLDESCQRRTEDYEFIGKEKVRDLAISLFFYLSIYRHILKLRFILSFSFFEQQSFRYWCTDAQHGR